MTVNSPSGSTLQCNTWLWNDMPLNSPVAAPCNATYSSGIMTLNSPGGSTLQCCRWLWDDMPWNSPKRPPYCNSTSGFDFDHIPAVDMSFCTSLQNFIQISQKMRSCRFSRWRISAILDFRGPTMGSLNSPCTTSYRSSIETMALNCLVFEKIAFLYFGDRQTNRQTDEQMDSTDALSRFRCHERRLNKARTVTCQTSRVCFLQQTLNIFLICRLQTSRNSELHWLTTTVRYFS